MVGMGMTDRGTGMATDTEICILICIHRTLIRVPAGYTRTCVLHYSWSTYFHHHHCTIVSCKKSGYEPSIPWISSQACIISPSSWCAQPYWSKGDCDGISFRMTETDISKCVAKVAVRVVQSGFERVFTDCLLMGELRTYNGSRLLKLVVIL